MDFPGRTALVFTLLFAATAYSQQEGEDRLRFGALRFGMSLDEARAASPETQWTVVDRHSETGRAYVIRGARAVTLAGTPFDLEMGSRPLGANIWTLESNATTRDAAACEARALAVIAELERHFGEFHEHDRVHDGEIRRSIGKSSSAVVSAMDERLRVIRAEKAMLGNPPKFWVRSHHAPTGPDDLAVQVGADYEGGKRRTCGVEVRITGSTRALELKDLVAPEKLVAQPTISYRNRSLRNVGVPSETLRFSVPCLMHAGTGKISVCHEEEPPGGAHHALARQWALGFQFALENARSDDERLLAVRVPVQMGPADVRTMNPSSAPPLAPAQVRLKKRGGEPSLPNFDLKAPVEVTVLCEVMEDGSLICEVKPGASVPAALGAAAVLVAEQMQLEPTLRDGTSAVGRHVEHNITFKPGK